MHICCKVTKDSSNSLFPTYQHCGFEVKWLPHILSSHPPKAGPAVIMLFNHVPFCCSITYVPAENLDEYRASLGQQTEGAVPFDLFPSHTVRWVKRFAVFSYRALRYDSLHTLCTVQEDTFYFRRAERWMIFIKPAAITIKSGSEYNFCFS